MPACHSMQTNYWLWETGQSWLGLVKSVCLLGALKTMLWHGRKTSPVSASAYILGGNLSGVCAGAPDPDMMTSAGSLDTSCADACGPQYTAML